MFCMAADGQVSPAKSWGMSWDGLLHRGCKWLGHLLFSLVSVVTSIPSFPGGKARCPWWASCNAWRQLYHDQRPWKCEGATSSVLGISRELRPSIAERRSNNLPFSPPPPFSFQQFHRILWFLAKSYPQGHSAAMGPSSCPAGFALSWPRSKQIAQGHSWWKITPCLYCLLFAEMPWQGLARAPPQTLVA